MDELSRKAIFEVDADTAVRARFATGEGVIALQPGMDDNALLTVIKYAIKASEGKAFVVVPPSR